MLSEMLFGPGHWSAIANAAVFAMLGVALFITAFVAVDKATPYALWKGIIEEKNSALAILVGSMAIAMGIIIAAAIH